MSRLRRYSDHSSTCQSPKEVFQLSLIYYDSLQVLTKDQVTARVDAVVYFRVADPIKAVILAENYFDSTFRISQSTLRDVLGTKSLSEILSDREAISEHLGVRKCKLCTVYFRALCVMLWCCFLKW